MANELNLNQAVTSDYTNTISFSSPSATTDGVSASGETRWSNPNCAKYWGWFNQSPELKGAILMKAIWDVGRGLIADDKTTAVLDRITGWGKSNFIDILYSLDVTRLIYGDAYAEIIKNDNGTLLNLKPLDPASMVHVVDDKGILLRFEQISKTGGDPKKFNPEDIFYLPSEQLVDQIHGISRIAVLESTLKAEEESFADMTKLMHLQAKPFILWKLKTDDVAKIANFKSKIENARKYGEDGFIPDDDDAVTHEVIQLNPSQIVIEWRNNITNKFYRSLGLPLIIFGQAGSTESGGKIEYLAHEQVFEYDQRFIENQVWQQLGIRIDLISPTSLMDNLQTDQRKDGAQGLNLPAGDMTSGN